MYMQPHLLILGVAYLLLPFFLLFAYFRLNKKLKILQGKVETLEKIQKYDPLPTVQQTAQPQKENLPQKHQQISPSSFNELIKWLKIDWPMKVGAFLLLLGFGWLTTYAFMNNWIGPVGRITLGIAGGLLILILGEWRIRQDSASKSLAQGSVLIALGAATILLTLFAARTVYDFFTPSLALIFMALVIVFVAYASVKHRIFSLGILGLLMGGVVPLLVDSPEPNFIGLFSYLLVLCAGTLWVVGLTGWRVFNNLALALVALYSVLYLESLTRHIERSNLTEFMFATAFALLFFASNIARMLKNKIPSYADLLTAAGNGLLFLFWIHQTVGKDWKSLVTAAAMLIFSIAAYALLKKTVAKESIYMYGAVAFLFLVAATRFEIRDDTLLTLAYTLEATGAIIATLLLMKTHSGAEKAALLLIPAMIAGLRSLDSHEWKTGIMHLDFLVLVAIMASSLGLGLYFYRKQWKANFLFLIIGGFYAVAWVWLTADALIKNEALGVMAALAIYTTAGIGLNIKGSAQKIATAQTAGTVLIGLVVIRLLAVDVWNMDITGKIITFFVIGSLLLSTAFLSKKITHP